MVLGEAVVAWFYAPDLFICKSERLIASEYFETLKTQKVINNTIFIFYSSKMAAQTLQLLDR